MPCGTILPLTVHSWYYIGCLIEGRVECQRRYAALMFFFFKIVQMLTFVVCVSFWECFFQCSTENKSERRADVTLK